MPVPDTPNQNHLLAALPTAEFERLAPHLERAPLLLGQTLYEPGGRLEHVYFPTTAIVSLLYVLESGASAEIAGVGNEGVLSISLGVMNLFPIPALDGGRILFTLPEILFRKRIPAEWENMVNGVAMLLLIGLMLYVNIMDFVNPVQIPVP